MNNIKIISGIRIFTFTLTLTAALLSFLAFIPTLSASTVAGTIVSYIELDPRYPTPGQTVKATYVSPTIDLNTAYVTWSIDGQVYEKTFSGKSVTFTVGDTGSVINIKATAQDGKGLSSTAEAKIRVSDITLTWEGNTYTPPFYKGRALQGAGSEIRVSAIAEISDSYGNSYDQDKLSYIWTTNHSSVPEEVSGKGQHSVILTNKRPQENLAVSLQVKDPTGEVRVIKNITIPPTNPVVLLYEDSSSVGVRYDRAVEKEFSIYDRETTLVAEPYYMSVTSRTDSSLVYEWDIDGEVNSIPGLLSFSVGEESTNGISYLELVVKNSKYWLQNGRSTVRINFGSHSQWGGVVNFE